MEVTLGGQINDLHPHRLTCSIHTSTQVDLYISSVEIINYFKKPIENNVISSQS